MPKLFLPLAHFFIGRTAAVWFVFTGTLFVKHPDITVDAETGRPTSRPFAIESWYSFEIAADDNGIPKLCSHISLFIPTLYRISCRPIERIATCGTSVDNVWKWIMTDQMSNSIPMLLLATVNYLPLRPQQCKALIMCAVVCGSAYFGLSSFIRHTVMKAKKFAIIIFVFWGNNSLTADSQHMNTTMQACSVITYSFVSFAKLRACLPHLYSPRTASAHTALQPSRSREFLFFKIIVMNQFSLHWIPSNR